MTSKEKGKVARLVSDNKAFVCSFVLDTGLGVVWRLVRSRQRGKVARTVRMRDNRNDWRRLVEIVSNCCEVCLANKAF